ncbi:MAG: hypothetical protein AB1778_04250 [Candidatus Bipolaricaulota bacterium]
MSSSRRGRSLHEDWLAVLVGLVLVLLAGLGFLSRVPWPLFGWLG